MLVDKDKTSPKATRKPAARSGVESARGRKAAAPDGAVSAGSAAPRKRAARPAKAAVATLSSADRLEMIRQAAYYRAERRGFAPGRDAEDWLAAEAEVDAGLAAVARRPSRRAAAGKRAN
jgi:hypothetical protein